MGRRFNDKRGDLEMFKKSRALSALVGMVCAVAMLAMGATAFAATGKAKPKKGKADSGTAYVGTTHTAGAYEYLAGDNTDRLFGAGAVTYRLKASPSTPGSLKLTTNPVILFTATGSLRGTGSATLTITSATTATVSNGKLNLTKGTGTQKGHSLIATFTGSGNPTTGQYVFHYKGTYK